MKGMEYILRPMVIDDIPQVVEIEKQCFPTPWSAYAFTCELCDNEFAHYLVLVPQDDPATVYGYGGMWIIIDEAHITNIAISPVIRGKGQGERLMNGLISLAGKKKALRMTLEVRVSNTTAQKLYRKLNFKVAGLRPGYYADTNEDALIMWKEL